jgi:hypothetical protein
MGVVIGICIKQLGGQNLFYVTDMGNALRQDASMFPAAAASVFC